MARCPSYSISSHWLSCDGIVKLLFFFARAYAIYIDLFYSHVTHSQILFLKWLINVNGRSDAILKITPRTAHAQSPHRPSIFSPIFINAFLLRFFFLFLRLRYFYMHALRRNKTSRNDLFLIAIICGMRKNENNSRQIRNSMQ